MGSSEEKVVAVIMSADPLKVWSVQPTISIDFRLPPSFSLSLLRNGPLHVCELPFLVEI